MSARDVGEEGVELPMRGASQVASAPAKHPPHRPGRRRTTLAELSEHLETHSERVSLTKTARLALAAYTLARVVANLHAVGSEDLYLTCDAVLRPVMTGLGIYFFIRKNDRFSEKSLLHIWSRRAIFLLAFFVGDEGFRDLVLSVCHGHVHRTMVIVCNGGTLGGTLLWEIAATSCKCT